MSTGRASGPFTLSTQHQHNRWLPRRTLKRKFDSLLPGSKQGELNYPSPPMSDPPSPPQGPPASTTIQARPAVSTTANSTAFVVPGLPALVQPPPGLPAPAPYGNVLYPSSFSSEPPGFGRPLGSSFGIPQTSQYAPAPPPDVQTEASTAGPSTSRTGRKSKAHVASACINCKRAHLSCDIQRPCARCVASGKQVSSSRKGEGINLQADQVGRIHASTYNTKNEVDRDFARKASSRLSKCFKNRAVE